MDLGLKDKVALITGGSVGIGLAIAHGLAEEGAHVVICARGEERAKSEATEIANKYGGKALGIKTDVTNPDDIQILINTVQGSFGGLDI